MARRTRTSDSGALRLLVGLELLERRQRREARDGVDVAGQQRRHLGRRVADEAEGGALHAHPGGVAVPGPGREHDAVAPVPAVQHIGAGADGPRGGLCGAVRVQDDGGVLAEPEWQHGLGLVEHQDHRVRVLHDDAGDVVEHRLLGPVRAGGRAGAVEAELDSAGVEGLAVGEAHALAQDEGVGLAVDALDPALGQERQDGTVRRDLRQALEDVQVHDLADGRGRGGGGVQAGAGLQRHAKHDAVACPLGGGLGQGGGQRRAGE
jgi:hypothetical protein